ncbi:S8 family serine peptidase [Nonomuraea gerenzanensis]|uniref:Serine protease n=1 Tax=Nonomuraea gerenzanensis TaxID=93944 RepID=A0A1M4ERC8_9ACTN|nr:S8 family serine peptidase [Nonomuraea gerenzanensis]UBU12819.1 S8 family serine peptidase [Nonomuraea gerenzanensis]SBP01378.1 serine protease [Nonomuraea gerenzanensis]
MTGADVSGAGLAGARGGSAGEAGLVRGRVLPLLLAGLVAGAAGVTGVAGSVSWADGGDEGARVDDVAEAARAGQWQLGALRLPEAWRSSKGAGVVVAVLDTGVNTRHPDLRGAVIQGPDLTGATGTGSNAGAARTRPDATTPGRTGSGAADDGAGAWGPHGTAMASLIAGRGHGDARRGGVIGVAPAAKVLSIRVTLENGDPRRDKQRSGWRDALAEGIRYAADHGADVISMSLGGGSGAWEGSAVEEEAVQYAIAKGAVLVASSGNDGEAGNRKNFPAAYPGVIAVGAVDRRLRVAPFSNKQDYVSVVAPGTEIVTADGSDSYVVGDGTSSAAAMVAGIAALIRSAHPDLSPYHVRLAIELGTRRRPADGYSPAYGHGVANALLALKEAARLDVPASEPPAPGPYFGAGPAPGSRMPVVAGMLLLVVAMSARVVLRHTGRRGRDAA